MQKLPVVPMDLTIPVDEQVDMIELILDMMYLDEF